VVYEPALGAPRAAWNEGDAAKVPDSNANAYVIKPLLNLANAEEMSLSMAPTSAQRHRALDLLKARGMLRLKDFMAEGIGPETLARLVREEAVVRPARGLYQLPGGKIEAAHMLAEAAVLVPKGVVCLTSALQYHELTLQMPSAVWMAIERTAWRPKIDYPRIRFVRFTGPALTEGIKRHRVEGVEVPITDPARTIVDCFRYRAKVGLDVAMEGLREGLRRRRCTPNQLWRYARKARVWSVMRPYVEAMASDAA
jgi:predicted transcriptional regulator of viral defense system